VDIAFNFLALLTLAAAVAAMSLRNLIHCALCLVVTFFGAAALLLVLGAEFVSFAQVMVYVGAIAILIVFVTLLTRNTGVSTQRLTFEPRFLGLGIAAAVASALLACIFASHLLPAATPPASAPSVRELGERLMTTYVVPLEIVGLLLTAALLAAVVIAMPERKAAASDPEDER
jgi:NADH-quinone oxidoreductase subunit J